MSPSLLLSSLLIATIIYVWIGQQASKTVSNSDTYYLMGKSLTSFPLMMTLLATQLGGSTLIGVCDHAYQQGWITILFPLGTFVGFLCIGFGFGRRLQQLSIKTTAQVFEHIYQSTHQKYIASLLSIISLLLILVAQATSLSELFASLHLAHPAYFITFWLVLILYTVIGGLKAVVNTDIVQALFIVIILIITFLASLSGPPIALTYPNPTPINTPKAITQSFLMPFLFMLISQDMGQRFFAAKKGTIPLATLGAAILFLACSSISIYFGILAKQQHISLDPNQPSSCLIQAVDHLTHPIIATLCIVAIFMAIISTADSLLFAISSHIFCDFIAQLPLPAKQQLTLSKCITASVGLLALAATLLFPNIIQTTLLAYSLSVCTLAVPVVLAIFIKKPSKIASAASMIAGSTSFILYHLYTSHLYLELKSLAFSLGAYLIAHTLIYITNPTTNYP